MGKDRQQGFERRMFEESETVYQQISIGQVEDVEAALMDAQLRASADPKEK